MVALVTVMTAEFFTKAHPYSFLPLMHDPCVTPASVGDLGPTCLSKKEGKKGRESGEGKCPQTHGVSHPRPRTIGVMVTRELGHPTSDRDPTSLG